MHLEYICALDLTQEPCSLSKTPIIMMKVTLQIKLLISSNINTYIYYIHDLIRKERKKERKQTDALPTELPRQPMYNKPYLDLQFLFQTF